MKIIYVFICINWEPKKIPALERDPIGKVANLGAGPYGPFVYHKKTLFTFFVFLHALCAWHASPQVKRFINDASLYRKIQKL